MKLVYIKECDHNGTWSEPELHAWNEDIRMWVPVRVRECKTSEYEEIVKKTPKELHL